MTINGTPVPFESVEHEIDIADQTFVVAGADELATRFADGSLWWPELDLTPTADRGGEGIHWALTGALAGTAEIWLEPWRDGVVVHWFVRANRVRGSKSPDRIRADLVRDYKRRIHALKDELERTRAAGLPRPARSG